MDSSEVVSAVERHFDRDAVKENVVRIARTPAPQTELYEREPRILRAIRELYRPAFESLGCRCWIDDYGNLFATQGDDSGGPHVAFISFAMTWTEGTMRNPWSGEVVDGREVGSSGEVVWGRGGSEYHPSNAALLETARIVAASGVPVTGRITYVVSSAGHTSSSDPIYHLLFNDQFRPDLVVTPGNNSVMLGNMGRLDLRVNVYGKSVHSGGELSAGSNAIEGGLEALRRLEKIMPFPPRGIVDPDMGRGRLSVIGLASYPFSPGYHDGVGSGGHTLQNLMRFLLDRRLAPGEDVGQAIKEIEEAVGELGAWRCSFERGALQYPTKHERTSAIVRSVAEAYEQMLGRAPKFEYADYTIDAGFLNDHGIPTIMWGGIDMRYAHGDQDNCHLDTCYEVAQGYAYWAIRNAQAGSEGA